MPATRSAKVARFIFTKSFPPRLSPSDDLNPDDLGLFSESNVTMQLSAVHFRLTIDGRYFIY